MTDDRPDLPEVLSGVDRGNDVESGDTGGDAGVRAGDGDLLVPREDPVEEGTEPGMDRDQDPEAGMTAWFRAAEGLVLAYWHDPRTAIKYAVAILRLLQEEKTEKELLAIDPTEIPPITEIQAGWQ